MRMVQPRWARPLKVVGFIVLLLAIFPPPSPQATQRYRRWTTTIGPGVRYTAIRDPRGPYRIKIISVRLAARSTIDVALANDRLAGALETTTSMARRHGAVAAVNGDFGLDRPVHPFGEDGHIVAWSPFWQNHNFAVNRLERQTFIAPTKFSIWMERRGPRIVHSIRQANAGPPGADIALYTPVGGSLERPPGNACSARLFPLERPRLAKDGTVVAQHKVAVARCGETALARRGGKVISARRWSRRAKEIRSLRSGDLVTMGWSPGWAGVYDTLGGWPILMSEGRIAWRYVRGSGSFYGRHPRTGVGYDKDLRRVLFVTVDGRQPGYSIGMTPRRFARLFEALGAEWALNLDGGGSTTSVVRGQVRNRPSDGSERPVSSALLVLPKGDSEELAGNLELARSGTPAPQVDPALDPLLRRIARDPGSTGGLASALIGRGFKVPPALQWSAVQLERSARR